MLAGTISVKTVQANRRESIKDSEKEEQLNLKVEKAIELYKTKEDEREKLKKQNEELKKQLEAKLLQKTVRVASATYQAPVGDCGTWMSQAGITDQKNAYILIMRESGCRVNAQNSTSSAYGIPQALPGIKMASVGADWKTNPVTQLKWMQGYIVSRYGTWANAVAHSQAVGWY